MINDKNKYIKIFVEKPYKRGAQPQDTPMYADSTVMGDVAPPIDDIIKELKISIVKKLPCRGSNIRHFEYIIVVPARAELVEEGDKKKLKKFKVLDLPREMYLLREILHMIDGYTEWCYKIR